MAGALLHRIGQGYCGTVYAESSESEFTPAIKREDGLQARSLYNDFLMHKEILHSFSTHPNRSQFRARVPQCLRFANWKDPWWDTNVTRFPANVQVPCNALITQRIPPFSRPVRESIIDTYCPESLRSFIKSNDPDKDCLIRPYLGRRRRPVKGSRFQAFSLRNYPLHLDQIEQLGLDARLYARIMATTLAPLYWSANVDGNDVEFVLAPDSSRSTEGSPANLIKSDILGEHVVWLLDFDCCRHMSMDEEGVEQAVTAFYRNDPFFPRPGKSEKADQDLWVEFRKVFLDVSKDIYLPVESGSHLPEEWVKQVEDRQHK